MSNVLTENEIEYLVGDREFSRLFDYLVFYNPHMPPTRAYVHAAYWTIRNSLPHIRNV